MEEVSEEVREQADRLEATMLRRKALASRPDQDLQDNIICSKCKKKMPWQVLEKEVLNKVLCINGFVYCIDCAKDVAVGMEALMLKMNKQQQANYFKEIRKKVDGEVMRKKLQDKFGKFDEEIEWDDAKGMKKLLRNRDGSMETKSLFQKVRENIKKHLFNDAQNKKIIVGGSNVG